MGAANCVSSFHSPFFSTPSILPPCPPPLQSSHPQLHPYNSFPFSPSRYNLQTPLNASGRFKPPPFVPGCAKISRRSFSSPFDHPLATCRPAKILTMIHPPRLRNAPCTGSKREGIDQPHGNRDKGARGEFRGFFEASVAKLLNASRICARRFQTRKGRERVIVRR